ncbi:MAG: polyribonucleotide nucleotidyltransferase [Deltaproteobacteria bacterium]|nr:polyribonucleotide nucleotidyltransferase [Deltaproteobacteria bacterium]
MAVITKNIKIGDRDIKIETGKVAKQANGSVTVQCGETIVLVTAVSAKERKEGLDFFPLTVDYLEKLSAAGRIPGSYFRREGRLTDRETLSSRVIDRSLRPLFAEGYANETQVIATVLSFDQENDSDVLALTGASAALACSDIPFNGPIAGVRVGRVNGKLVANPTLSERAKSDIDIVMAASREAIVMVEGGAEHISEAEMVDALMFGKESVKAALDAQEQLTKELKKTEKRKFDPMATPAEIKAQVKPLAWDDIKKAYAIHDKGDRYAALGDVKKKVTTHFKEKLGDAYAKQEKAIKGAIEDLKYEYMRGMVVDDKKRIGDRAFDGIRPISCDVSVLPRTHGSALFQRGETQAIVSTTLGTKEDDQRIETLTGEISKRFLLHYNFPPYSVGEIKPLRGPGRREVGHGALAERALLKVMPDEADFPYVVRIVSEITESNGSSSMASVCGGCLSLMDAGVPIKAPVAGIAMGLIKEGEKIAILSDILGDEDHLGDMDFKVCGTEKGITSIQMDIKITGVTREIMATALEQARKGRMHILEQMAKSLPASRKEISKHAPRITVIKIRPERIKDVIGPGGKVIKDIIARTGCSVNIDDNGDVAIASSNQTQVEMAIKMVQALTQEAEVGRIYLGTVRKITDFGAFVELFPGTDGLVHISELSDKRVKSVEDVVKEGEEVLVKVISVDRAGKIRLSRKEALAEKNGQPAAAPSAPPAKA